MDKLVLRDALDKQRGCNDEYEVVYEAFLTVTDYIRSVRDNGLLSLEDKIISETGREMSGADYCHGYAWHGFKGLERLKVELVTGILNGIDPDILNEIVCRRYFSSCFEGREALAAYILIKGFLMLQIGEPFRNIELELMPLLPEEAEDRYIERKMKDEEINGMPDEHMGIPGVLPEEVEDRLPGKYMIIATSNDGNNSFALVTNKTKEIALIIDKLNSIRDAKPVSYVVETWDYDVPDDVLIIRSWDRFLHTAMEQILNVRAA